MLRGLSYCPEQSPALVQLRQVVSNSTCLSEHVCTLFHSYVHAIISNFLCTYQKVLFDNVGCATVTTNAS